MTDRLDIADRWTPEAARPRITDTADELQLLWPALHAALIRDTGTTAGAERVDTSNELAAPVNPDVLRALHVLGHEIPATDRRLADLLAEPHHHRDIPTVLRLAPPRFDRLVATNALNEAQRLDRDLSRWQRLVKRAVGLLAYDRPLGQYCPRHDDELTELVELGDEGWLQPHTVWDWILEVLPRGFIGPPNRVRARRTEYATTWTRNTGTVRCHHCGVTWTPSQMLFLGRLLREADRRRVQAQADGRVAA